MKGTSSLNPYAASYIPLSQRGEVAIIKDHTSTGDLKSNKKVELKGRHSEVTPEGWHPNAADVNDTLQIAEGSTLSENSLHNFNISSSQNPDAIIEKSILDEDGDMDLAYLQMTFPEISDDSLSEIYFANNGDLEAAIDMLNQFELNSLEKLPDTLEIGDVSESGQFSNFAYQKLKKVAGEVGDSSPTSSASSSVT